MNAQKFLEEHRFGRLTPEGMSVYNEAGAELFFTWPARR